MWALALFTFGLTAADPEPALPKQCISLLELAEKDRLSDGTYFPAKTGEDLPADEDIEEPDHLILLSDWGLLSRVRYLGSGAEGMVVRYQDDSGFSWDLKLFNNFFGMDSPRMAEAQFEQLRLALAGTEKPFKVPQMNRFHEAALRWPSIFGLTLDDVLSSNKVRISPYVRTAVGELLSSRVHQLETNLQTLDSALKAERIGNGFALTDRATRRPRFSLGSQNIIVDARTLDFFLIDMQ